MRIIYRISDTGYSKVKPEYITNEKCLANATEVFQDTIWSIIADNVSKETEGMMRKYVTKDCIDYVSKGSGAETFNLALDKALQYENEEIIYFSENDYLHRPGSEKIIKEGLDLGASFVTLYDHPEDRKSVV